MVATIQKSKEGLSMSNFTNLQHYILPSDLLITMLDAYKQIGMTKVYLESIESVTNVLEEKAQEEDCFYLSKILELDITEARKNLIISKNSNPRNYNEEVLYNIKNVLSVIKNESKTYKLNASELLSYMNQIFGKFKYNYTNKTINTVINKQIKKQSIRMMINECFDEYDHQIALKKYESIILSNILYFDIINLEPFNGRNDFAGLLSLYYLLLQNKIEIFKYVSFFKYIYQNYDKFIEASKTGSLNYSEGFVESSNLSRLIFSIIIDAYNELSKENKKWTYKNNGFKSDNVESSIYKMPEFFSKEDVRRANPNVSDATINRILNRMRDEQIIMPLGTGRSAKWRKNPDIDIPLSKLLGD